MIVAVNRIERTSARVENKTLLQFIFKHARNCAKDNCNLHQAQISNLGIFSNHEPTASGDYDFGTNERCHIHCIHHRFIKNGTMSLVVQEIALCVGDRWMSMGTYRKFIPVVYYFTYTMHS